MLDFAVCPPPAWWIRQLQAESGVSDNRVLERRWGTVPREAIRALVRSRSVAYVDEDLEVASGQVS